MDQSRVNAIRARCEAAEDNYKSVRANSELMELFHVDIPDLIAEVERLGAELAEAHRYIYGDSGATENGGRP